MRKLVLGVTLFLMLTGSLIIAFDTRLVEISVAVSADNDGFVDGSTVSVQPEHYTHAFAVQQAVAYSGWPMFHHDPTHNGTSNSTVPSTNMTMWNYTTGNPVKTAPAVTDGMVFIGSYDYRVYALDESTGEHVWNYTVSGVYYGMLGSPAVADGMAFMGSPDHTIYALNESTGEQIWNYTASYWVQSSPAVAEGMVFIGSHDHNLYALNESTGERVWSFTADDSIGSSPAVADGMVFVGSHDHNVYALNESTGQKIWNYSTSGIEETAPAVASGIVLVGSADGIVYALNESTGSKVWSYVTGDGVWSSPAIADGMVFIGSNDHNVYAFGSPLFGAHDVAVAGATVSKSVVSHTYNCTIKVTVLNEGNFTEIFNLAVYANTTCIETQRVVLAGGSSTIRTFIWNTTGFAKGNYAISAVAEPVSEETNTTDNTFTGGSVQIVMTGDVTADGKVDVKDVYKVAKNFGTLEPPLVPPWDVVWGPVCDINNDGRIDVKDYYVVCKHYGEVDS